MNDLTVIGPSSRLAALLGFDHSRGFSLRAGETNLPQELNGKVLIFSDPPSVETTRASFLDLLSRIDLKSRAHLILVSSISASNADSAIFPIEGSYARRKRLAEQLVLSREDLTVTVVRIGNVKEYGGWRDIFSSTRLALFPTIATHAAVANIDSLRAHIAHAAVGGEGAIIDAFEPIPLERCFRKVVRVPGLMGCYRAPALRLPLRVLGKIFRRIRVYLPSPDDLNSFLVKAP